jgi:hypothetical protein
MNTLASVGRNSKLKKGSYKNCIYLRMTNKAKTSSNKYITQIYTNNCVNGIIKKLSGFPPHKMNKKIWNYRNVDL